MNEDEKRERRRLAAEADRLTKDDTLIKALAAVRQSAIDALIRADATVPTDIVRLQAKVTVCDEFMSELKTMVDVQTVESGSRING